MGRETSIPVVGRLVTPTQRSLAYLRKRGWRVAITEHWNPFARVRQDLFGFIDLMAVHPERKAMGIQTTTTNNLQARINKALALPSCRDCLRGGLRLEFHGWDGTEITVQEIILDPDNVTLRVI